MLVMVAKIHSLFWSIQIERIRVHLIGLHGKNNDSLELSYMENFCMEKKNFWGGGGVSGLHIMEKKEVRVNQAALCNLIPLKTCDQVPLKFKNEVLSNVFMEMKC